MKVLALLLIAMMALSSLGKLKIIPCHMNAVESITFIFKFIIDHINLIVSLRNQIDSIYHHVISFQLHVLQSLLETVLTILDVMMTLHVYGLRKQSWTYNVQNSVHTMRDLPKVLLKHNLNVFCKLLTASTGPSVRSLCRNRCRRYGYASYKLSGHRCSCLGKLKVS